MSADMGVGGMFNLAGTMYSAGLQNNIAQQYQDLSRDQQEYIQNALAQLQTIKTPGSEYDLQTPEEYAFQGYDNPLLAEYQLANVDPGDRQAQLGALAKMGALASGAADSELNAANYNAINKGQMQRQAADRAAMANLASRGTAGSGLELAARLQGSQNAANTSTQAMMDAARNNALAKLQGNNAYLQGMGQLRNQDQSQAEANANIINQFNMANTNSRNAINQKNAALRNQQSAMNVGQHNQYNQYMADKKSQMKQQEFANQLSKGQAIAGQSNQLANFGQQAGATGLGMQANIGSTIAGGLGNAAQGFTSGLYSNVKNNTSGTPTITNMNDQPNKVKMGDEEWDVNQ